jgi:peptidoglycan/LPS O-acetylase OafA/YrhL
VLLSATAGRTGRLGMLDVLRFVAAGAVVGFHFLARDSPAWGGAVPDEVAGAGQWAAYGRLGVPLFFVISGFVILMSSWGRDVPDFVASRVGRLYPAYWVSVVLSVAISFVLWPTYAEFFGGRESASEAVLNLTMVQQAFGSRNVNGVYWTLWYEARFYLLIALLVLIGMTRRRILAFAALWPVAGAIADQAGSELLTTLLLPTYAPFFAGGMLLYVLYRDGHDRGTWLLVGLQAATALYYSLRIHESALTELTPFAPSGAVIAVLTLACFGLVALATLTPAARWNARWMVYAGALTYPVYLLHENLGWFVIAHLRESLGAWGAVGAAVVAALVASMLVHHLVEKPLGPVLRRVTADMLRRTTDRTEAPAAARPAAHAGVDHGIDDVEDDDWRERTLITSPLRLPSLTRDDAVGAGRPGR